MFITFQSFALWSFNLKYAHASIFTTLNSQINHSILVALFYCHDVI